MSTRRITISVPEKIAARIKKAAGDQSVSAWVTGLIEQRLEEADFERIWDEFYRDVAPRPADKRKAEAIVRRLVTVSGPASR